MPIATMTSKGQITVPSEVRADLRLHAGDRVRFEKGEDGVYRVGPVKGDIRALSGFLQYDGPPVSIEDMDRAIGEAVAARDERSKS